MKVSSLQILLKLTFLVSFPLAAHFASQGEWRVCAQFVILAVQTEVVRRWLREQ